MQHLKRIPRTFRKQAVRADKRTVWHGIDRTEVLLYAELLLGNAQAAAKTAQRVARAACA